MVHWYPKLQPCLAVLKWRTRLEGHEPINLRLFKFQGISILYPLAIQHSKLEAMAHLRMTYLSTMVIFHSYVSLPEGKTYQPLVGSPTFDTSWCPIRSPWWPTAQVSSVFGLFALLQVIEIAPEGEVFSGRCLFHEIHRDSNTNQWTTCFFLQMT